MFMFYSDFKRKSQPSLAHQDNICFSTPEHLDCEAKSKSKLHLLVQCCAYFERGGFVCWVDQK